MAANAMVGCSAPETFDVPRQVTLEETFRLGGFDAPQAQAFLRVPPRIAVGPEGEILVPNGTELREFDSEGNLLRRIGGGGTGPGEFDYVIDMGFVGDSIWARDYPRSQISVFSPKGEFLYSSRVHSSTTAIPWDVRFTGPTMITGYLSGDVAFANPALEGAVVERQVRLPAVIGNRDLTEIDTAGWAWSPPGTVTETGWAGPETFRRSPLITFSRSGIGYATASWVEDRPGEVTVRLFAPSGTETWSRVLRFPEAAVSRSTRDSIVYFMTEKFQRSRGASRDLRNRVERGTYLPPLAPTVRDLLVGADGSVWLLRLNEARPTGWVAVDGKKTGLIKVVLPEGHLLRGANLETRTIWTAWEDELGTPYVSQFRVRGAPQAGGG